MVTEEKDRVGSRAVGSYDEVADKFRDCAEFAKWPTQKTESVIELVRSLERATDLNRLTAAVTS